jgi:integrase
MTVVLSAPFRTLHQAAPARSLNAAWAEWVEAFVAHLQVRGYSALTIRDYRADVLQLAQALAIAPEEASEADLGVLARRLAEAGATVRAVRRRVAAYARFLAFLRSRRAPPLLQALLGDVAGWTPPDLLLLRLLALAGLRPAEIARLEWRDVRLRREELCVRAGMRLVPLHPDLVQSLREVAGLELALPYRPVLSGWNGFPLNVRTVHARFHRIAGLRELPEARPEDLRREVAERLLRLGTPPGLVRAFLGKDRGRPIAPRRGKFVDLTCLAPRLQAVGPALARD